MLVTFQHISGPEGGKNRPRNVAAKLIVVLLWNQFTISNNFSNFFPMAGEIRRASYWYSIRCLLSQIWKRVSPFTSKYNCNAILWEKIIKSWCHNNYYHPIIFSQTLWIHPSSFGLRLAGLQFKRHVSHLLELISSCIFTILDSELTSY